MNRELWVVRCGLVPYAYAREAQKALERARQRGEVPDVLLLLEHPPVYTKGRRTAAAELPMGEDWYRRQGIDITETDRGGRVTYHGPGQLVAYPIMALTALASDDAIGPVAEDVPANRVAPGRGAEEAARLDVVDYVRRMERVTIAALRKWGVAAQTIAGLTGVWTTGPPPDGSAAFGGDAARKIGSIGIHVNRGVTTHGLAINVNNDLQPFEWIVPCGIESCRMTSLSRELGTEQDLEAFATTLRDRFAETYEREAVEKAAAQLGELVEGVGALAGPRTPVR